MRSPTPFAAASRRADRLLWLLPLLLLAAALSSCATSLAASDSARLETARPTGITAK